MGFNLIKIIAIAIQIGKVDGSKEPDRARMLVQDFGEAYNEAPQEDKDRWNNLMEGGIRMEYLKDPGFVNRLIELDVKVAAAGGV